jgi:branched-chain amino acid transport system substrate-binding protein
MKQKRLLLGVCVCVALCLSLGVARSEVGVTSTSIKIGIPTNVTGPSAFIGRAILDGAKLYFDEMGPINGRKLDIIVADDESVPGKSVIAYQKLVQRDQVFAIFGGGSSNTTLALLPLQEKEKVPFYVIVVSNPLITKPFKKYMFRSGPSPDDDNAHGVVDYLVSECGLKKIGIIHDAGDFGAKIADYAEEGLAKHNMKAAQRVSFNLGDIDFTSQISTLKKAEVEGVVLAAFPKEASIIWRQADELGLQAIWAGTGYQGRQILPLAKEHGVGKAVVWYGSPALDEANSSNPGMKKFWDNFMKKYPKTPPGTPTIWDFNSYVGAKVFVEGLKRAGKDLTRDKFIAALEGIKNFGADDGAYPISFSATNHQGSPIAGLYIILPQEKRAMLKYQYVPDYARK